MAGICFYFEDYDVDVYSGRHIDLDAWNHALCAGGADMDTMLMLNQTDQIVTTPNAAINFEVRNVYDCPELEGKVAFFVWPSDERAQQSLWEFDHQVDWYCFGPAQVFNFSPKEQDVIITIPIPVTLYAVHAASVVMAHRHHVRYE